CRALILRSGLLAASRRMRSSASLPSWFETRAKSALLTMRISFDRPDQGLDLVGMRAELPGELVEIRVGNGREAGFVNVGHDLHPDRFQLRQRLMLEFDRFRRLVPVDLVGCGLHPALLLARQAVPPFVADPDQAGG